MNVQKEQVNLRVIPFVLIKKNIIHCENVKSPFARRKDI